MRSLQSVKFIEEVKKREEIWNPNIPQFKDKCLKRHRWDEICAIFRKNFNDADYNVKVDIRRSFQNQWRNIKDCYRKYLRQKRNNPGSTEREYVYADRLRFLDPVFKSLTAKRALSNAPTAVEQTVIIKQEEMEWGTNVESGEDEQDDIELLDGEQLADSNELQYLNLNEDPFNDRLQDVADRGFGADAGDQLRLARPESAEDQRKAERKREWEREDGFVEPARKKMCLERTNDKPDLIAESSFNRSDPNEDDDLNFFLSLMPVVRPMALEEKLKFRMDVMKICLDYHRKQKRSTAAQRVDHNVRFLVVPEAAGSNPYDARQNSQATPAYPTSDPLSSTADKI